MWRAKGIVDTGNVMKYIKLLTSGFGNSAGEVVKIDYETEDEIYYTDGFDRQVYLLKSEEDISFEYIQNGECVDYYDSDE